MPQAVDIVLKNGAGVSKTFTLMTPAAGDNSYAQWRLKEGAIPSIFPRIAMLARAGNRARKAEIKLQVPSSYLDTVTGLTKVGSQFDLKIEVTVPDDFPEALREDTKSFAKELVANAIAQAMVRDAYPAT